MDWSTGSQAKSCRLVVRLERTCSFSLHGLQSLQKMWTSEPCRFWIAFKFRLSIILVFEFYKKMPTWNTQIFEIPLPAKIRLENVQISVGNCCRVTVKVSCRPVKYQKRFYSKKKHKKVCEKLFSVTLGQLRSLLCRFSPGFCQHRSILPSSHFCLRCPTH